ncbi:hypothetical protein HG537_0B02360 [Torulaspora globosa]|uniref:Hsp70 nucleotide exchange factor FES1 n=1 Tax=Torulaspora globosa TaxID=48254 RepID=A0A7H9HM74_9SACH|nr:hypothetical protein HG537_0B02360 [Torulaspora sp. CBS 2947]
MEKLLHWSIANAQGDKEAIEKAGQPDPKLLQQLFGGGGPDDPTLMKEAIAVVRNPEAEMESKLIAMDNFEMLIENLDNANNIENLKLWTPLLETLSDPDEELRASVLSVIGTAAQNNLPTQNSFLKQEKGLSRLIKIAGCDSECLNVRCKALYALSNLVRNHPELADEFVKLNGLDIIAPILTDLNVKSKLKTRALSLLTAYLTAVQISEGLVSTLRKDNVLPSAISSLKLEDDIAILDRVLNFLSHLISAGVKFTEQETVELRNNIGRIKIFKDRLNEEDYSTVERAI